MGYPRANCSCRIVGVQGIWGFGGGHVWSVSSKQIVPNQGSVLHCDAMPWYALWCWCCQRVPTIFFKIKGGGANVVSHDYTKGDEIVGTSILVYTVFSATVAQRNARHSRVLILAPLPIGFAVFLVHLATIPIKYTGINPARSVGAAIVYNRKHAWMTIVDCSVTPRAYTLGGTDTREPLLVLSEPLSWLTYSAED
ncbi:hypothetical protein KY289_003016 [Solanum tuberosum]|nr:hypothetical protein KY289_003016 [Solanum tuberosum]